MFKNNVLVFVEINVPKKAPELTYVTIGCSDLNELDSIFESEAIQQVKERQSFPNGTNFICKGIHKFSTTEQYDLFLQNQLAGFLKSDRNNQ